MMSIVIWLGLVSLLGYFLVRKFKSADEKLQNERSEREARMLAAAMAWKASQMSHQPPARQE